jgi:four helix bundle protein
MKTTAKITHRWQLEVYQLSIEAGMSLFELSKKFPREEMYSLTDQVRRSSRSVSSHISEGWRRRRYEAAFCEKLNGAESEAAETQTWIEYSVRCGYVTAEEGRKLHRSYDHIMGKLVNMQNKPEVWLLQNPRTRN